MVGQGKKKDDAQIPQYATPWFVPIACKQKEKERKEILPKFALIPEYFTLHELRTIGKACGFLIHSLFLKRNCKLAICTNCCFVLIYPCSPLLDPSRTLLLLCLVFIIEHLYL